MAWLSSIVDHLFPDALFYALTILVFIFGLVKCCRPVLRNAGALRRATDLLKEGAKAKLGRPVWTDQSFLGKRLMPVWRAFLQSADVGAASGVAVDVADFVHDDVIIHGPGKATLADVIPGLCTSLGILGTFVGLSMGLSGLDLMEVTSYIQLTSGIALAFNTSIVGIIASMLFNILYRYANGKAQSAIDQFATAFYSYAIHQPPDALTQILTYEKEQSGVLAQFGEEMGGRLSGEIQHAISSAMAPVTRSMEEFLSAATQAQIDGLDYIVARFVDRMNSSLDNQLHRLSAALSETADGQLSAQEKLRHAVDAIGDLTQGVTEVHAASDQVVAKFAAYVGSMNDAYRSVNDTQADTQGLLSEISDASARQSKYLSALQEYQAKLQGSFQDYTLWTDKYVGGLEEQTLAQNASLERIAMEMRASSELLRGSYESFTESIQLGLANALGLFEDNMQTLIRQVNGTLADVQSTMGQLEGTIKRATEVAKTGREVN